jgi:hypothetical protein
MSAVVELLDRLERVKQTGSARWLARCPAHQDKSPSLSIRALDDGRVLINCFAGCEPGDVLSAVGLTMSNLFPKILREHSYAACHSSIPAADLLIALDHELTVAVLILEDVLSRRTVNAGQVQRLCQAAARVGRARDISHGAKVVPSAA